MADDPNTVADDEVLDDGTAAQEAAEDEEERQAAAAAGMDTGGSTSENIAESTPEDGAVMDSGGGAEGGGGGGSGATSEASGSTMTEEQAAAYEEMNFGAGEDDDSASVYTPDELEESLDTGEDKIEDLGGSTSGGEEPSLGDFGGYGTSGELEPSVADGAREIDFETHPPQTLIGPLPSEREVTTYYDKDGQPAAQEVSDPDDEWSYTSTRLGDDGSPVQETRVSPTKTEVTTYGTKPDGTKVTKTTTRNDKDIVTEEKTTEEAPSGGAKVETTVTTNPDSGLSTTTKVTTTKDGEGNTTTNTEYTDEDGNTYQSQQTTDANGDVVESSDDPLGGDDPVPGGQAESHVEELQEQMPEDTGPGDVDPNEYDDGEGSGDPTWDVEPGVDDPPDEQESSGGPVDERPDQGGWDVDPADEEDFGGGVGADDDSMELPTQEVTLDPSQATGSDGDDGSGHPEVQVAEEFQPIVNAGIAQGRTPTGDDSDFGSGGRYEDSDDSELQQMVVGEVNFSAEANVVAEAQQVVPGLHGDYQDPTAAKQTDLDLDEATANLLRDAVDNSGPASGGGRPVADDDIGDDLDMDG